MNLSMRRERRKNTREKSQPLPPGERRAHFLQHRGFQNLLNDNRCNLKEKKYKVMVKHRQKISLLPSPRRKVRARLREKKTNENKIG